MIYYDKKRIFNKNYFKLPIHAVFKEKNGTIDVLYPNSDSFIIFLLMLGLNILDSINCLGSKVGTFIQNMKPAVWSNSAKLPELLNHKCIFHTFYCLKSTVYSLLTTVYYVHYVLVKS